MPGVGKKGKTATQLGPLVRLGYMFQTSDLTFSKNENKC